MHERPHVPRRRPMPTVLLSKVAPSRRGPRMRALIGALTLLALCATGAASAQAYSTGAEVIRAVDQRPTPPTVQSTLTMTITSGGGQSLSRTMSMWSASDDRLIKFTAPANIAGSGFLIVAHADGSEETMVYLPALGRVRRIAAGQQSASFFGSDFSYEDITGIAFDDYAWKLRSIGDGPSYVVRGNRKPGAGSSYPQLVVHVPESTLIPTRIEYVRDGEVVKVLTVADVHRVGDYLIAGERRMESLSSGNVVSFTVIEQSGVKLDTTIPPEVFSERFLRQ